MRVRPRAIIVRSSDPLRVGLVVLVLAAAVLTTAVGGSANPDIRSKREQAQAILAQVQQLDAEVGDAAERWNGANYELTRLSDELRSTRRYLAFARSQLQISRQRAALRLRELYMHADTGSALEVILGARSLSDVVDRVEVAKRIGAQDAGLVRGLRRYGATVVVKERDLNKARVAQAEIVQRRTAEKQAIEAKLAERTRLLASIQDEVRRLEAEERRHQAELQRQALARLALQRQLAAQARVETQSITAFSTADPSGIPGLPATLQIPSAPPPDGTKSTQVVTIAMQYLGVPYVWGGASPSGGFDCSGLTMFVFNQVGVSLPHHAASQYGMGVPVSMNELQSGDLVFFHGLGHMGMYIGGGNFIHAPHTGDVVKISTLASYASSYVGARRVL